MDKAPTGKLGEEELRAQADAETPQWLKDLTKEFDGKKEVGPPPVPEPPQWLRWLVIKIEKEKKENPSPDWLRKMAREMAAEFAAKAAQQEKNAAFAEELEVFNRGGVIGQLLRKIALAFSWNETDQGTLDWLLEITDHTEKEPAQEKQKDTEPPQSETAQENPTAENPELTPDSSTPTVAK